MKIISASDQEELQGVNPSEDTALFSLPGLAALFGAMRDPVLVTDQAGVVLFLNPAAADLTGWVPGRTITLESGRFEVVRNDHRIPLSALTSPLAFSDDGPSYYAVTLHDLTGQKLNEEILHRTIADLEKSIGELTRSNTALQKFSHIAAHDLKSPVSAIVQLTDLLAIKYADSLDMKGNELLRCIADSAGRMRALIDDLLNYSSLTAGGPHAPTDCTATLEQALANLKGLIQDHGALVSYSSLPQLSAAPPQLVQVFQNLIRNAIQYAGIAKPEIRVSASARESFWLFSVRNNGQGIAEQYHETIFEPFQRLHGHEHAGSGIGLAVCRKIIESAGGKIWVESKPGEDTVFFFTLP